MSTTSINAGIEFLDELPGEPETRGPRGVGVAHYAFADALKRNPGRWAKYPLDFADDTPTKRASRIRTGIYAAFPRGEFQAEARLGVVYVRAIGGQA